MASTQNGSQGTSPNVLHLSPATTSVPSEIDSLVAENARLRQLLALRDGALDASPSGFMIIDVLQKKWPIVYANKALSTRTGYSQEELIGMPSGALTPREPNQEAGLAVLDAMKDGRNHRTELQSARKNGSLYWTGIALAPIRNDSGQVTHFVSVSADITAKIEAEQKRRELLEKLDIEQKERARIEVELNLAQKLESVGRLAAGVAHEINTPIQYVGDSVHFLQGARADFQTLQQKYRDGFAAIIAGESILKIKTELDATELALDIEFLTTEIPKAFQRTLEGVERVATIVRAMKEFSHPDAVEHQEAEINRAIETTLVVAANEYKYVATLTTDLADLPPVVCNIGELNQVFLNLVINAAHAITETGKDSSTGCITIATRQDGDHVELKFSDNGCGIPQANIDKIFDPFFTTKEVGKGTGQGLAITRSIIVDKHGGTVNVTSTIGAGSQFLLRLPIAGKSIALEQTEVRP